MDERRRKRRAAFEQAVRLRKEHDSFETVLRVLQAKHAEIFACIAVIRGLSTENRRALDRALSVLAEDP